MNQYRRGLGGGGTGAGYSEPFGNVNPNPLQPNFGGRRTGVVDAEPKCVLTQLRLRAIVTDN